LFNGRRVKEAGPDSFQRGWMEKGRIDRILGVVASGSETYAPSRSGVPAPQEGTGAGRKLTLSGHWIVSAIFRVNGASWLLADAGERAPGGQFPNVGSHFREARGLVGGVEAPSSRRFAPPLDRP